MDGDFIRGNFLPGLIESVYFRVTGDLIPVPKDGDLWHILADGYLEIYSDFFREVIYELPILWCKTAVD